jgi:hypothetical protein
LLAKGISKTLFFGRFTPILSVYQEAVMSDVLAIYETLKVKRRGTEDDFEVRCSDDEKVWGVRITGDSPSKPTIALYAGPDAKEYASDLADFDYDDEDDDEDDGDDDEEE